MLVVSSHHACSCSMVKAGNLGMPCPCPSLLVLAILNSSHAHAPKFILLCNCKECPLGKARWKYKVLISPPSLLTADSSAQSSHRGQLQSFRSYGGCRTVLSREFWLSQTAPTWTELQQKFSAPSSFWRNTKRQFFPRYCFHHPGKWLCEALWKKWALCYLTA